MSYRFYKEFVVLCCIVNLDLWFVLCSYYKVVCSLVSCCLYVTVLSIHVVCFDPCKGSGFFVMLTILTYYLIVFACLLLGFDLLAFGVSGTCQAYCKKCDNEGAQCSWKPIRQVLVYLKKLASNFGKVTFMAKITGMVAINKL